MKSLILWKQLCNAVTAREWKRLEQNDPGLAIGQFNRNTLLSMRDAKLPLFEIPEADIQGLSTSLQKYLDQYMAEQPEGHKWIILACLFLALLQKQPMHPQSTVNWIRRVDGGGVLYLCPCKESGGGSICEYCVCQEGTRMKRSFMF